MCKSCAWNEHGFFAHKQRAKIKKYLNFSLKHFVLARTLVRGPFKIVLSVAFSRYQQNLDEIFMQTNEIFRIAKWNMSCYGLRISAQKSTILSNFPKFTNCDIKSIASMNTWWCEINFCLLSFRLTIIKWFYKQ